MAGNTAYLGVLEALDGLLRKDKKGRKSVECYKEELSKLDKKVLTSVNSVYNILHLSLGYYGELNANLAKDRF